MFSFFSLSFLINKKKQNRLELFVTCFLPISHCLFLTNKGKGEHSAGVIFDQSSTGGLEKLVFSQGKTLYVIIISASICCDQWINPKG